MKKGCSKNDGGEVILEKDVGQSITVILKRKDILSTLFSYCAFCIHILLIQIFILIPSKILYWSLLKKDKVNIRFSLLAFFVMLIISLAVRYACFLLQAPHIFILVRYYFWKILVKYIINRERNGVLATHSLLFASYL